MHAALAVVLAVAFLAMAPAILLGRIPAETHLCRFYGPWSTAHFDRLHEIQGGDSFFVYLPDLLEAVKQWKGGHLPLWNPHVSGGMPILGMQTSYPLDPLILLLFFLPIGTAMGLYYMLLLFVAGAGMVALLRGRGLTHPVALSVAGVAFALNPYFVSFLYTRVFLTGLATLPWALWAVDRLVEGHAPRRAAGVLALSLGYAGLSGTLQTLALFVALVVLRTGWVAVEFLRGPGSPDKVQSTGAAPPSGASPVAGKARQRSAALTAGLALVATLAGLAIAALPLIAGTELLAHSTRLSGGSGYYLGSNYLPWRSIALWFSPGALHGAVPGSFTGFKWLHRTFGGGCGWGALGVGPLFFAIFGLVRRSGPASERLFWAGAAGLTLLVLLVLAGPLYAGMRGLWPPLDTVDLLRGLIVVNLAGAVLGGWGAQAFLDELRRPARSGWLAAIALLGLAGAAAVVAGRAGIAGLRPLSTSLLPLGAVCGGLVIAGFAARRRRRWAWLLPVVIAAELGALHFKLNAFAPADTAYPHHPLLGDLRRRLGPPDYPRFLTVGHVRVLPPNVGSIFDLNDIRGYSDTPIARYRLLLECAERCKMQNQVFLENVESPIYRLLGLGYAFIPPSRNPQKLGFEPVAIRGLKEGFYRRRHSLPRAFVVHAVVMLPDENAVRRALTDSTFDPARVAYLAGPAAPPPAAESDRPDTVEILRLEPARLVLRVRAGAPGLLVLSDPYYPGWQATLDGHPVPILPADWGVRGVAVPAGDHAAVFEYRPRWLVPGGTVMVLALSGALVAAFWPHRRRQRRDRTPGDGP